MRFSYLLDKIDAAKLDTVPFRHVEIDGLFSDDDFAAITHAPEIKLKGQASDADLFDALFQAGYKIIEFPGCITDREAYIKWHRAKSPKEEHIHSASEGFGMTLRLVAPNSGTIAELVEFLNSDEFQATLLRKFGVDRGELIYDAGIQKYLDGYEISPHPDIRKKALTYMININPAPQSESIDHHTHYLRF